MSNTLNPEIFQKTFNKYVLKWHILEAILFILAFFPFLVDGIARILDHYKIDFPPFFNVWHSWVYGLFDITFAAIATGIVSIGAVSFGVVSIGTVSCGIVSIGTVSFGIVSIGVVSCGIISIGVVSIGVFAFGNASAIGVIAISTGSTGVKRRVGGNAYGIVSIGRRANGLYSLSYDKKGNGVYLFSPERQDIEAITFFTRYLPKFKRVYE